MMTKHLVWLFVLGACTDFESVDRGVCGNGLLEAGEDCDSSDAQCVSCAVTCSIDDDCPTADFLCGADGLCHAPGGALAKPQVVGAFEANEYHVADVDHDGHGDVVGASRSSLVVRFGDAAAPLSRLESAVTPPQTGPAAFGDLDQDTVDDVTITTLEGLVSFTSGYGRLSGVAIQEQLAPPGAGTLRHVLAIGPTTVGLLTESDGKLYIGIIDFPDPTAMLTNPAPCGQSIPIADFSADNLDVYQVRAPGEVGTDTLISLVTGNGTTRRVCVLSLHKDNVLDLATVLNVTPTTPGFARKGVLADLTADGDPCPSLVNSDSGVTMLRKWDGALQANGHCAFAALSNALPPMTGAPPMAAVIGRAPFQTLFTAPDALVVDSGVFAYSGGWGTLYTSTRAIRQVGHGDIDGDGDIDVALRGPGDDIDLLVRAGVLFQSLVVDTASEPKQLAIEDFDGNGDLDIGYTEPVGSSARLMVAYGTPDRPLPPVEVSRFEDLLSVAPVRINSPSDYLATIADLVVLLPDNRISILTGSTQRTMLSFFDPRQHEDLRETTVFRATAIGHFASPADYPDVVGLAALSANAGSVTPTGGAPPRVGVRAWSIRGTTDGLETTASNGVQVNNADDCSVPGGTGLCVDDATYLSWSIADGHDVVIAADASGQAAVYDPAATAGSMVTGVPITLAPMNAQAVRSLRAADFDGDGDRELIASFGGPTSSTSAILVCDVDSMGVPRNCRDLLPDIVAADPATLGCFDAVPGRFVYRSVTSAAGGGEDLVVLCRDSGSTLYRVSSGADGIHVALFARNRSSLSSLEVGDVTGDRVPDVLAIEGEAGARSLVVFPQCTNRETACVGAEVSP